MDKGLENLLEKIRNSDDLNKELILKFSNYCFAQGLSDNRVKKYIYSLIYISKQFRKEFDKVVKEDVVNVVAAIEKSDYEENTKRDFKVCLKKLFSWIKNSDPGTYPDEVRFFTTTAKKNREKVREILTEQEINSMIGAASTIRDKAILTIMWQSGCRVGELINMSIKDAEFDDYSPKVTLRGKTGVRKIRIFDKENYLKSWINEISENGINSPMWVTKFNHKTHNGQVSKLNESGVNVLLKKLAEKTKIQKKVYPHLIRASRATFLASQLKEQQIKKMFGWTQSSSMLQTYISQNDVILDEALLKMNGHAIEKEQQLQQQYVLNAFEKVIEKDPKFLDQLINKMKKHGVLKHAK